jgi:hypothetical protein
MKLSFDELAALKDFEIAGWERRYASFKKSGSAAYYGTDNEALAELRGIHTALSSLSQYFDLGDFPKIKQHSETHTKSYSDPEYTDYSGKFARSFGYFNYRGYRIEVFSDENSMEDYGRILCADGSLSHETFSSWNSAFTESMCGELDEFIDLNRAKARLYKGEEAKADGRLYFTDLIDKTPDKA